MKRYLKKNMLDECHPDQAKRVEGSHSTDYKNRLMWEIPRLPSVARNDNIKCLFSILFLIFYIVTPVHAQSPTAKPTEKAATTSAAKKSSSPTTTPPESILDKLKQIKQLKEKIATKVAQLRTDEQAALLGTVQSIENGTIVLQTLKGERSVRTADDVVAYTLSGANRTEAPLKNIKAGDTVSAFGFYQEGKTTLTAQYVFRQPSQPFHLVGKIADKDAQDFTITVKSKEGETIVDIEKVTKTFAYDAKEKSLVRAGFSKLAIGDTVHVSGLPAKEENRVSALRISVFPFTSGTLTPAPDTSPTPKTGTSSATKKPSPTPKFKPSPVSE